VRAARGLLADVRLDQLVFLDEFGATTNMSRRYARGPVGRRVVCKTPHGHWKILSTIAAMTVRGILCSGTFDGATDTDTFVAFVREGLVPALAPGQVVIMDNLPAHRASEVDELVESAGAYVLRLPPYSPTYRSNSAPSIGQAMVAEAVAPPPRRTPATAVITFQCPAGAWATQREPAALRPWVRTRLVIAPLSSRKITRAWSPPQASARAAGQASRRAATSGRCCSVAWSDFFFA
jgi:hypothetical protein